MWPVDVEKDTSVSICTLWKEEGDFVSRRIKSTYPSYFYSVRGKGRGRKPYT